MARSLWTPSRREVLRIGGLGAAATLLGVPGGARALGSSQRKFIFVFARGGWDTTRVFSPMFHAAGVQTESDAATLTVGDHVLVDHPGRPAVRSFYEQYGARLAVLDGMLVRSVNHAVCERLVLTADTRPATPDWPSILGAAAGSSHALPSLVLSGPSAPGSLHRYTSVLGRSSQVQSLLDGTAIGTRGDLRGHLLLPQTEAATDAYLERHVGASLAEATHPGEVRMLDAYADALARVARLRDDGQLVRFDGESVREQATLAVELLRHGVTRVANLSLPGFDTHADIDKQIPMLDELFGTLHHLMQTLDTTPGAAGGTLADETVVVVVSEMGRAPYLNESDGKDHWPYTAAMLLGPGVQGGRRIGGYDAFLNGRPVHLASGDVSDAGVVLTPAHLGATLLTLGDVDPAAWLDTPAPVGALLT